MIEKERGFQRDEEVVVKITGVTDRGLGRAEIEALVGPQKEHKIYEIFVRKAVPGDTVRVRFEHVRRRRCTGYYVEMIEASPLRIEPRCPHFGQRHVDGEGCGGCTFQMMSYRHQLAIKERRIKDHFKNAGLDPGLVLPLKGMDEPWHYRNKMEFSFGDTPAREFALGMHPTGYSYEIVNLDTCLLPSPFAAQFVPLARQWALDRGLRPYLKSRHEGLLKMIAVREAKRTEERMVELVTTSADEATMNGQIVPLQQVAEDFRDFALSAADDLGGSITSIYWTQNHVQKGEPTRWIETHLHGRQVLREELHLPGDRVLCFDIHPRAFFQPNTLGAEILYRQVIEYAGLGDDNKGQTVLDLYCGTGTIGMCVAPFVEQVIGIEMQPDAVANARQNAAFNGIENIEFFAGNVGDVLDSEAFEQCCDDVGLVIVDPPRSGLQRDAIEELLKIRAPRIVYVSCNPATLATNLVDLSEGGYDLEVVQPIDMFPQTYHVECVAVLKRI